MFVTVERYIVITVNSEIFVRVLFSQIPLMRNIAVMEPSWDGEIAPPFSDVGINHDPCANFNIASMSFNASREN